VLAAAFAQALVSGGLYALSLSPPDFLKAKVLSPGFWVPFGDAQNYFLLGQKVLTDGFAVAARHPPSALYVSLLGLASLGTSHPLLSGLWLNGLLHLALMPLAFQNFRSFSSAAGLCVAFGIGFLPSSLLYTSQLLRDALIWIFLLTLVGIILAFEKNQPPKKYLAWFSLAITLSVLTEARNWVGYSLGISVILAILLDRKKNKTATKLGIVFAICFGILVGQLSPCAKVLQAFPQKNSLTKFLDTFHIRKLKKQESFCWVTCEKQASIQTRKSEPIWFPIDRIFKNSFEFLEKPPFFFVILNLADLIFVCDWYRRIKHHVDFKTPLKKKFARSHKFLMISIILLALITFFFSDGIGNLTRYLCPIVQLILLTLFLSYQSPREIQSTKSIRPFWKCLKL